MRKILFAFLCVKAALASGQLPAYKNASLPVDARVNDLLTQMTPEEKFWQLFMIPGEINRDNKTKFKNGIFGFQVSEETGAQDAAQQLVPGQRTEAAADLAKKINATQKYLVENTRLGIPAIFFDEALHGLVRANATVFPQAIGLAATWDTALMHRVAGVIATEAKTCGIKQILSPVINIASDVRWGRTEETYGEDPFLTSEMGVAFVQEFERRNIITTPKHFIANAGDGGRDSYPIHFNDRLLEEIHLVPFKAVLKRGGARSVMTAYNSLDGIPCSSNDWLLNTKLKKEWGFGGFVISDAGATGGANVLHFTAADYADASQQSISHGLDVIFQTSVDHSGLFIDPFLNGKLDTQKIDDAVRRVLKAKFELGLFENPYVPANEDEITANFHTADHIEVARQAARESVVLLKNAGQLLPLSTQIKTLAVIGQDATEARMGGYSGSSKSVVSILDGIKSKIGKSANVIYSAGCGRKVVSWNAVEPEYLTQGAKNQMNRGLAADYFNNCTLTGTPAISRTDEKIDFHWTLYPPDEKLAADFYSVRWTGKLKSPKTGRYKIGLDGNDGYRLFLNGKLLVNKWSKQSYSTQLAEYDFKKDSLYDIKVEFFEPNGNAHIRLVWNMNSTDDAKSKMDEAVRSARQADAVVIVAGIHEGEFQDRAFLALPGNQEELIHKVAATGKPVIVLLSGGSAVVMNNWLDKVQSVLAVWYPGEQGGHALADILFGDYNPAGRLPVTYPMAEGQLPLVYNHKPTGRGDDYNDLTGLPLFPFGFGLSYSTFEYTDLRLDKKTMPGTDSAIVSFTLKNAGAFAGDEVVQLYIRDMLSSVAQPVISLKGFKRIHLEPGTSQRITFKIMPAMLSLLNEKMESVVEPGDFRIMVGASSRDIRLKETLKVK